METQTVKKAHPCPYCNESFDYKIELGLHMASWHRGKTTVATETAIEQTPVCNVPPPPPTLNVKWNHIASKDD